ncbi:zinc finger protein 37 isoform X3 [Haplochromis burtoni]|uniref:zinc finger protein 37 isoform X3 n=1 Tax=Haplochromis burtoni TaxID=8153 RepID=UPI001C2D150F|nr:zinc finger protein 37 isoform X3 [Haplochromis burtoni]
MAEEQPPACDETPVPLLLMPANTTEPVKEKVPDKQRAETKALARDKNRLNIGAVFHRWKHVREQRGFKTDAEFATFLLDRTEKITCFPHEYKGHGSTSEEETAKGDGCYDDSDDQDYVPPVHVRAACLSAPKSVTKQVPVHDAVDAEQTEQPPGAETIHVQRNKPYHPLGNQHKDQEQKPENTCSADQSSRTPGASSRPPSYELELTPSVSHHNVPKKINRNETNTDENPSEDHRPETQDHSTAPTGELPKWTLIEEKSEPKASPATVHMCGECGMDFPEKHKLEEHREIHWKPFACPDCGKRFKHNKSVKMHMRLHSGDLPYLCSECGKTCVTMEMLKKHKLTHTGEKNYHCDQCGRAFLQSYNLNLHLKTHTGERSFLCSICGKRYSRADTLKVHLRVHTGENPYACKICGKCFYYNQGYQAHVKIHDKKPKTSMRTLGRPKQQLIVVNKQ